jgi:hypothetical protein
MVSLARIVLGAEFVERHGQAGILNKHRATVLPSCKLGFLDSQINGAVFMLQRTLGTIPLASELTENEAAVAMTKLSKMPDYLRASPRHR